MEKVRTSVTKFDNFTPILREEQSCPDGFERQENYQGYTLRGKPHWIGRASGEMGKGMGSLG